MNALCKFTTLHDDLHAKIAQIHHSKMPLDLVMNSANEQIVEAVTLNTPGIAVLDVDRIPKWQNILNPKNWNSKLKAALEGTIKKAGSHTFTKIMNF